MSNHPAVTSAFVGKNLSRADLLRTLLLADEDTLSTMAELCGYKQRKHAPVNEKPVHDLAFSPIPDPDQDVPQVAEQTQDVPAPRYFYRVIDCQPSPFVPLPEQQKALRQALYEGIPDLDLASVTRPKRQPPEKLPQVPWSHLWPALQRVLMSQKQSTHPDINGLTKKLAQAEMPIRIPRQVKNRWFAEVQVLVDKPKRILLFEEDMDALLDKLEKHRGRTGLSIHNIVDNPGNLVRTPKKKNSRPQPWQPPEPGSAIFILSDLGVLDHSGQALQAWISFGIRLRSLGFSPIVWFPLPQRYLTPALLALFDCYCWTMHSDLQKIGWVQPRQPNEKTALQDDIANTAHGVLAWISPLVQIEPRLLRAVCRELEPGWQDSGIEAATWLHDDIVAHSYACYLRPETLENHRQTFRASCKKNPALALRIIAILRHYHAHWFPTEYHEEMLVLSELVGDDLSAPYKEQTQQAVMHFRQLLKAMDEKAPGGAGLPSYAWHYLQRQPKAVYDNVSDQRFRHVPAMHGILYRDYIDDWDTVIADGTLSDEYILSMQAFASRLPIEERYVLSLVGQDRLRLCPEQRHWQDENGFSEGCRLASFDFRPDTVFISTHGDSDLKPMRLQAETLEFQLSPNAQQTLHLCGQALMLERMAKPAWAAAISCQRLDANRNYDPLIAHGSRADSKQPTLWYWHTPMLLNQTANPQTSPGFWYYQPPNIDLTPAWADLAGRDRFGLYADVTIAGVLQRFRWISPGSFLMGSPNSEEGRFENEILHQVNLSQGYWLADTACTQALWQAVMKQNPSRFKGKTRPVESVSWKDVQKFLDNVNDQFRGLAMRLPTEAEWENACRADTTVAFNFTGQLSLEKVNYRGTWEYKSNKSGDFGALQQTAEIKSYPPNPWGLYEMHGNVLEWCQDWYGEYPNETVIDPQGPDTGDFRVLRGGSWCNVGRDCLSGSRRADEPDFAVDSFGFRLARGHEPGQDSAGQPPRGAHAAVARGAASEDGLPAADRQQKTKQSSPNEHKGLLDNFKDLFKK